ALLEQLPIGVIVTSRDGQVEHSNPIARALIDEHRLLHAVPEPWLAVPGDQCDAFEPIRWLIARALLIGEVIREEEIEFVDAHDEWRTLSASATPIRGGDGEVEHVVVTFADVTLQNRARDWEPVMKMLSRL